MDTLEERFKTLLELLVIDLGYTICRCTYTDFYTRETIYVVRVLKDGKYVTPTMVVPKETWENLEILEDAQLSN